MNHPQSLEMEPLNEEKLRDAFELLDTDKDGELNADEIQKVVIVMSHDMRALVGTFILQIMNQHGIYPTVAELTEMIEQVDRNSNGTIDYQEFLQMMLDISKVNNEEEDDIQQAFRVFDKVKEFK